MTGFRCLGRLAFIACCFWAIPAAAEPNEPRLDDVWDVADLREGMTGYGLTVLKGTKLQRFTVEVLGVLESHSPGRDLVLVRTAGIGLEKTGVISGMSGSPVYIEGRLVGAIAYTWQFGTEPLAGITPIKEMKEYGKAPSSDDRKSKGVASLLLRDSQQPADRYDERVAPVAASAGAGQDGFLVPIQTPVTTSGISAAALEHVLPQLQSAGLTPVQGGAATERVRKEADAKIEPGGAMAVGLITGDVSMTAVGTVTVVDGDRVFGFGHPFFGIGSCQFPLMTAYIHGVIPRQTVSSKMGSALTEVGVVDTDVSTCVAGWMGKEAPMIPVSIRVKTGAVERDFECKIVQERTLLGPLSMAALSSCTDMQGQAPADMTAELQATVRLQGYPPLRWSDVYSGQRYSGPRGLTNVFAPLANLLQIVSNNNFERPNIESVECEIVLKDRRRSATVKEARAVRSVLEPGETLEVDVDLQPYQPEATDRENAPIERVRLSLPLPRGIAPGDYTANVGDASSDLVMEIRNRRHLLSPGNFTQLLEFLKTQLSLKNDELVLRLNSPGTGIAMDGAELPNLPPGFIEIFGNDTGRTITPVQASTVERHKTDWVIEGSTNVKFAVVKEKDFYQ